MLLLSFLLLVVMVVVAAPALVVAVLLEVAAAAAAAAAVVAAVLGVVLGVLVEMGAAAELLPSPPSLSLFIVEVAVVERLGIKNVVDMWGKQRGGIPPMWVKGMNVNTGTGMEGGKG